jgi:hypothetical protein
MKARRRWTELAVGLVVLVAAAVPAHPQAPARQAEVTLKGSLVCNGACVPDPRAGDHVLVIFAIDGTPAVCAEVDRIVKDLYPPRGLDAEAAVRLMDRFCARLKFYLDPDSPALRKLAGKNTGKNHYCMPAQASAVTGTVTDKGGKKWITATRIEPTRLRFPDVMLEPDRPFVTPDRPPLLLKVSDKLRLKCVYIPPGKFLMGTPFYMWPYYVEEYPHLVTLTRPFYMAEVPVTQEVYEAVMGNNPSAVKDPQLPVQNPPFAAIDKFFRLLSERNGVKVRLPTDAEWEYAARAGTSNPGFPARYKEQNSSGPPGSKVPLRVRSRKPNAWGLYDMASCWWEITADRGMYNVRHSVVDPRYPPQAGTRAQRSGRGLITERYSIGTHEFITERPDYAGQKFRVVVEAGTAGRGVGGRNGGAGR